jgi:hypothetical protein
MPGIQWLHASTDRSGFDQCDNASQQCVLQSKGRIEVDVATEGHRTVGAADFPVVRRSAVVWTAKADLSRNSGNTGLY